MGDNVVGSGWGGDENILSPTRREKTGDCKQNYTWGDSRFAVSILSREMRRVGRFVAVICI